MVALLVPMGIGIRLSFASGFVLDAMPGWEGPMLLPRDEKLNAVRATPVARKELDEMAQRPDNTDAAWCRTGRPR